MQNSKQIAVQNLYMPRIGKVLGQAEISKMRSTFVKKLAKVFDDFHDYKISQAAYEQSNMNTRGPDFYFKLISKKIILLVEVPTCEMMAEQIDSQGFVGIKYRRFDLSLIKMDNLKEALDL